METMPSIRQHINQLTSLPSAARAVLIEVCELVENGGQGKCFAGNQHLAEKASCHPVSVSRHLALLKSVGLIEIEFDGNDNSSRTILPLPELVTAYTTGEVEGLNRVLRVSKQGVKTPLSRVLTGSKQGVNHTTVTTELTTITTLTNQLQAADAAVLGLREENEKLATRLANAERAYRQLREEHTALKAQTEQTSLTPTKPTVRAAKKKARSCDDLHDPCPLEDLSFDTFWQLYRQRQDSDKFKAKQAWILLPAATRATILAGLPVWLSRQSADPSKVKHATTFLNALVWEDESYQAPEQAAKVIPISGAADPEAERLRAVAAQVQRQPAAAWPGYTSKPNKPLAVKEPAGLYTTLQPH